MKGYQGVIPHELKNSGTKIWSHDFKEPLINEDTGWGILKYWGGFFFLSIFILLTRNTV